MHHQRSIVLSLQKKGPLPKETDDCLVATLGADARAYRTVAHSVHDAKCTHPKVTSPSDMISRQFDRLMKPSCLPLKNNHFRQFASCQELFIDHA
jgi:hypothetical protein